MGHGLQHLRIERGSSEDRTWPSSRKATTTALILLLVAINLPEINALFKDSDIAWRVYMACSELSKAMLAVAVGVLCWSTPTLRYSSIGTATWFVAQSINEAYGTNTWYEGRWEYGMLAICTTMTLWAIKRAR